MPESSLPPEGTAFPRPASPPFPGLGLLLRTAQNRLFLLLAGDVGEEALADSDDLLSDPVVPPPPVSSWELGLPGR